jgi:hypothetical protein
MISHGGCLTALGSVGAKHHLSSLGSSASAAAMTDPDPNPFADGDVIACYGGAKPADKHLASRVCCIDDEIIGWPPQRRYRQTQNSASISVQIA